MEIKIRRQYPAKTFFASLHILDCVAKFIVQFFMSSAAMFLCHHSTPIENSFFSAERGHVANTESLSVHGTTEICSSKEPLTYSSRLREVMWLLRITRVHGTSEIHCSINIFFSVERGHVATTILLYEGIVKRICEISFFSSDSDNSISLQHLNLSATATVQVSKL